MTDESLSRILVVDDDVDFASLLSDVFVQASYEVETINDPRKADAIVKEKDFSLVVTDLRMPEIDGLELARRIRTVQPGLPIIVVSGFLDNQTREQMEKEGVVGLYEKPLSVFSLLKNAAKLIADQKKSGGQSGGGDSKSSNDTGGSLGFEFSALPCESDASRAFAEALYRMRNRKSNLCIISPRGTPARAVAREFCRWIETEDSIGRILEPKECSQEHLSRIVNDSAEQGYSMISLLITDVEQLDPAQQKQLARATRKGALREGWDGSLRLIFFIGADLESLYQQGSLGDELYLSMGGGELSIPRLKECSADIRALAQSSKDESGGELEWDEDALRLLTEREWPGNHAELRKVILLLQQKAKGKRISATDVIAAASEEEPQARSSGPSRTRSLRDILTECRASYFEAAYHLLGEDAEAVAEMTRSPGKLIEEVVEGA